MACNSFDLTIAVPRSPLGVPILRKGQQGTHVLIADEHQLLHTIGRNAVFAGTEVRVIPDDIKFRVQALLNSKGCEDLICSGFVNVRRFVRGQPDADTGTSGSQ
jgi:hypothetical protein